MANYISMSFFFQDPKIKHRATSQSSCQEEIGSPTFIICHNCCSNNWLAGERGGGERRLLIEVMATGEERNSHLIQSLGSKSAFYVKLIGSQRKGPRFQRRRWCWSFFSFLRLFLFLFLFFLLIGFETVIYRCRHSPPPSVLSSFSSSGRFQNQRLWNNNIIGF